MKRLVVASDVHVPFHDNYALDLHLQFLRAFRPDYYVIDGDLLDCYQLSPFDRDVRRRDHFRDELEQGGQYLDTLAAALPKSCKRWLIGGNHEDRIRRYLTRKAPELADLDELDIRELLDLERRRWRWIPYNDPVTECGAPGLELHGILILHGIMVRKASGATAKGHFERFMCNGICGHSHRQGNHKHRAWGGEFIWLESGCLCTIEPPYMPSPDWQQGFIAGWIDDSQPDNPAPRFELHEAVIHNRKLMWQGQIYRA